MSSEELYITCLCGAVVRESNILEHVEDCLKEEFIQKSVSLKIRNSPPQGEEQFKERHVIARCIRCGHTMAKNDGTLLTFYPSVNNSLITCCTYRSESQSSRQPKISVCNECELPNNFHSLKNGEKMKKTICCADNIDSVKLNGICSHQQKKKWRERKTVINQFLGSISGKESASSEIDESSEHEHSVLSEDNPKGPPCKKFHAALLPNYKNNEPSPSQYEYSLIIQILDVLPPTCSVDTQTELTETANESIQVKILGVYPEEVEELLSSDCNYPVPEYDPAVEAAFESHLRSLIPCVHCERTFSPDRILKHQSCCIERPRTRECVTPEGGEIPR